MLRLGWLAAVGLVLVAALLYPWTPGRSLEVDLAGRHCVCVVVRTFDGQRRDLPLLLGSLAPPEDLRGQLALRVWLVDTDPESVARSGGWLAEVAQEARRVLDQVGVASLPGLARNRSLHGYQETDAVLDQLSSSLPPCHHVLVTNGDNLYSKHFWPRVLPVLAHTDLVAVNFVTHHRRPPRPGGVPNQVVEVEWRRQYVDLGAALWSFNAWKRAGEPRFLPRDASSLSRQDLFARDWFFFEKLAHEPTTTVELIHEVLFLHQ